MRERSADLQLEEDVVFQRRERLIQRVGWVALGAFVALAALGVFGRGPLSSARAGSPDAPLSAEYERFVRAGAPTRVIVRGTVREAASRSGFELRVPRAYFESFRFERLSPEPESIAIGGDEMSLQFGPGAIRDGGFTVILDLESMPVVIVKNGRLLKDRTAHERVDLEDVLAAARELHGLERFDQVKYAVLERSGGITIVPQPKR